MPGNFMLQTPAEAGVLPKPIDVEHVSLAEGDLPITRDQLDVAAQIVGGMLIDTRLTGVRT